MSIFPCIEHIDQLREKVSHRPEIRFIEQPNGMTVVCYMIGNSDLWNDPNVAWIRECRGISFHKDGSIAARSLHKFFNVGERPETQRGVIDWTKVTRLMDKRDGSMITPVWDDGKALVKSKKSFTSDVAILAQSFVDNHIHHRALCLNLLDEGYTPIFEYTSPKARIVINYEIEDLVLLHVRNNVTGEYLDESEVVLLGEKYNVKTVFNNTFYPAVRQMDYFFDSLETDKDFEGYVFQFEDGEMVKAKSKWYLDLHHNVTFLSERRVAEMVLDEIVDDFKSYLAETGSADSIAKVEEIEGIVSRYVTDIEVAVEALANEHRDWSKKDFAIKCCKHPHFGMAIKLLEGREPEYKEFFRRNFLKVLFGLDQV